MGMIITSSVSLSSVGKTLESVVGGGYGGNLLKCFISLKKLEASTVKYSYLY